MTQHAPSGDAADLARFGYTQELRRQLGLKDLLIYGLVFMVPIAPFPSLAGCSMPATTWCPSPT